MSNRNASNREIAAQHQGTKPSAEAIKILKSFKQPKFDQSVEVCVHLGIDPRQADQQIRGSIAMPHGIGKTARVVCFCQEDKIEAAKGAGAVEAGGEELVKKIEDGWMDFDVAVASPDMMRIVSKLGRALGPKGLMPSPKAGTVTPDVVTAVKEYGAGKTEYRNDDGGGGKGGGDKKKQMGANVHCLIGKMSFPEQHLVDNLEFFLDVIRKAKPAASKGTYMRKCVVSGTMTPSVQVEV